MSRQVLLAAVVALAAAGCHKKAPAIPPPTVIERPLASASVSPRLNHATVVLPDGRVLVVGGWGLRQNGGAPASADELRDAVIYDPAGDRWSPAGEMKLARLRHSATLMGDGRVLVVGGLNRDRTAAMSAEIFDPATGKWKDASGYKNGRDGHQAVALADGSVLVVGGMTSYPGGAENAEIFDPRTGTWQDAGKLPRPLYGLSLTALANGQVLAAGGFSLLGGVFADCQWYDPSTHRWTATGRLHQARYGHAATRLDDGRVVVTGGWHKDSLDLVEIYDPTAGKWQDGGKLIEARHTHSATPIKGGGLLIAGGQEGTEVQAGFYLAGTPVDTLEVYSPAAQQSQAVGKLTSPHFYHTASALKDGRVLVVGGLANDKQVPPAQAYGRLAYALVQFP